LSKITNLRKLRLRHGITLIEFADAAGVSNQQISRVELLYRPITRELEQKCARAMETVIDRRYGAVRALERDYRSFRSALLDETEDETRGQ